jgi:transposase
VLQLPGIGPVLAAVVIAEIGDISRFPSPGHLCSRARLTPRHRESDVKVARGHITKQGSPVLRWAMVEAIQHQPAPRAQGQHHRPPRHRGKEHRQGHGSP